LDWGPGGVAQWTSHPPKEQKTRVRIPPGYKVFKENIAMLLCIIMDLICIFCVLTTRNQGIGLKNILKNFVLIEERFGVISSVHSETMFKRDLCLFMKHQKAFVNASNCSTSFMPPSQSEEISAW
jgi:hypothetical protein